MDNRPWMMAIETQFAALRFWNEQSPDAVKANSQHWIYENRTALRRATPYAWTTDTATAVLLASRSMPNDTKLSWAGLPLAWDTPMWWWFDGPLPWKAVLDDDDDKEEMPVRGLLLSLEQDATRDETGEVIDADPPCLSVSVHLASSTHLGFWRGLRWEFDRTIDENVEGLLLNEEDGVLAADISRFIAAAFVWLNQRICQFRSGHIERHRRKQLVRENKQPVASDVKIIELRRVESSPPPLGHVSEPVDWSCRWILSGHWRNQAYANAEHKLIYILPYVKGPEDKPLRVPTHTVYAVRR
jgi:hypothetical protein